MSAWSRRLTLAGLHGGTSATDVLAARAIRTDIQALRAIAVIGVVLYHGNVPGFSGGYIGVDVFFVISGYLITGLLLRELQNTGCIALGAFWARRAWRLLPSALLVLSATMALSRWYLSPIEHWSVSQDILSTLVYLANYRFAARAVDYFDHDQATSPVLHFWSLSVEEQFYVFLPLLLLAVFRLSGRKRHLFA
ncbi:MAG: acyltransferase family protein, partial [Hyphomicrobiaceae bacterium]